MLLRRKGKKESALLDLMAHKARQKRWISSKFNAKNPSFNLHKVIEVKALFFVRKLCLFAGWLLVFVGWLLGCLLGYLPVGCSVACRLVVRLFAGWLFGCLPVGCSVVCRLVVRLVYGASASEHFLRRSARRAASRSALLILNSSSAARRVLATMSPFCFGKQ